MKKYKTRNGRILEVTSAKGAEGCLLNTVGFTKAHVAGRGDRLTFRIYHDGGTFTDYDVAHADPEIKFTSDGVYFYSDGRSTWIDHAPEALGYEEIKD